MKFKIGELVFYKKHLRFQAAKNLGIILKIHKSKYLREYFVFWFDKRRIPKTWSNQTWECEESLIFAEDCLKLAK